MSTLAKFQHDLLDHGEEAETRGKGQSWLLAACPSALLLIIVVCNSLLAIITATLPK